VVQIWSCDPRISEATKPSDSTVWKKIEAITYSGLQRDQPHDLHPKMAEDKARFWPWLSWCAPNRSIVLVREGVFRKIEFSFI